MFSPPEVLELVMRCRQTAHSATDFSPMDGNAKLKKKEPAYSGRNENMWVHKHTSGLVKM